MPRGSNPGERRGGRQKGTPNKKTAEQIAAIEASGLTPLDYLLSVMRDEALDPDVRLEAAKAAAPYVHPKLSQIDARVEHGEDDPLSKLLANVAEHGRRIHDLPSVN